MVPDSADEQMPPLEQALADDKMRAAIARVLAGICLIGVGTFLAPALATAAPIGATAALVKLSS